MIFEFCYIKLILSYIRLQWPTRLGSHEKSGLNGKTLFGNRLRHELGIKNKIKKKKKKKENIMPFFPLPGLEPGFFKDKNYQCATSDYVNIFVMVFYLLSSQMLTQQIREVFD